MVILEPFTTLPYCRSNTQVWHTFFNFAHIWQISVFLYRILVPGSQRNTVNGLEQIYEILSDTPRLYTIVTLPCILCQTIAWSISKRTTSQYPDCHLVKAFLSSIRTMRTYGLSPRQVSHTIGNSYSLHSVIRSRTIDRWSWHVPTLPIVVCWGQLSAIGSWWIGGVQRQQSAAYLQFDFRLRPR